MEERQRVGAVRLSSKWTYVVWLALVALVAAGCGGGSEPQAESTDAESPAAEQTGETPQDSQETVSLRYASPAATGSALFEQAEWFIEEVETRSNGRVEFETFYDGSLIGAAEGMDAVSEGRVDGAFLSHAYNPGRIPLWEVAGLPFITDNAVVVMRAMDELYQENDLFRQSFSDEGLQPIFFHTIGEGLSYTSDKVESLDGLKGTRLRVLGGGSEAFEEIGVEPVAVDPGEMYESIQRGVLDGAGSWALESAASFGMHEVAPHILDIGIGSYASSGFVVSAETWESLDSELQGIFEEVGAEIMATEGVEIFERINEESCSEFLDAGGSATVIPESEYGPIRDAVMDDVVEEWTSSVVEATGAERAEVEAFHEAYLSKVDEIGSQTDYVPEGEACAEQSE